MGGVSKGAVGVEDPSAQRYFPVHKEQRKEREREKNKHRASFEDGGLERVDRKNAGFIIEGIKHFKRYPRVEKFVVRARHA